MAGIIIVNISFARWWCSLIRKLTTVDVSLLAIIIALGDFNSVGLQVYSLLNFSKVIQRAFETAAKFFECRGSEQMPLFTTTDPVISVLFSTRGLHCA